MKTNKRNGKSLYLTDNHQKKQIENLITLALNKFHLGDIMEAFYKVAGRENEKHLEKWMAEYKEDEIVSQLEIIGNTVLKIETMDGQNKLKDFICTELFPYFNDQPKLFYA